MPGRGTELLDKPTTTVPAHTDALGSLQLRSRGLASLGGRAVGSVILRRSTAGDLLVCQCCPCLIEAGDRIYAVRAGDGMVLVICGPCAGER
jgi:hypothetical protein